jgi:hypothetical protein
MISYVSLSDETRTALLRLGITQVPGDSSPAGSQCINLDFNVLQRLHLVFVVILQVLDMSLDRIMVCLALPVIILCQTLLLLSALVLMIGLARALSVVGQHSVPVLEGMPGCIKYCLACLVINDLHLFFPLPDKEVHLLVDLFQSVLTVFIVGRRWPWRLIERELFSVVSRAGPISCWQHDDENVLSASMDRSSCNLFNVNCDHFLDIS